MAVILRNGGPEDAERCGTICFEAFKVVADLHHFPPDFSAPDIAIGLYAHLFERSDVHSMVAEAEGRIIGSNFLWENAVIAGVGPITVEPAAQNGAVGRQLMECVIKRAQALAFSGIRLVQARTLIARFRSTPNWALRHASRFRRFKVRLSDCGYQAALSVPRSRGMRPAAIWSVRKFMVMIEGRNSWMPYG